MMMKSLMICMTMPSVSSVSSVSSVTSIGATHLQCQVCPALKQAASVTPAGERQAGGGGLLLLLLLPISPYPVMPRFRCPGATIAQSASRCYSLQARHLHAQSRGDRKRPAG